MLTVYKEQDLKGFKLNNPIKCPGVYLEPATRLIELVEHSIEAFSRPEGYHLRFRLDDGVTISKLTDRICKAYTRPGTSRQSDNTFKPLLLWACENDPDYTYWDEEGILRHGEGDHYHVAVILDERKATAQSLHTLRTKFLRMGLVKDMAVIPTKDNGEDRTQPPKSAYERYGMELKTATGRADYIFWLSYICKVRTKESFIGTGQRVWDGSRLSKQTTPRLDGLILPKNHQNEVGLILS